VMVAYFTSTLPNFGEVGPLSSQLIDKRHVVQYSGSGVR
jgi:hypothetical protein